MRGEGVSREDLNGNRCGVEKALMLIKARISMCGLPSVSVCVMNHNKFCSKETQMLISTNYLYSMLPIGITHPILVAYSLRA